MHWQQETLRPTEKFGLARLLIEAVSPSNDEAVSPSNDDCHYIDYTTNRD